MTKPVSSLKENTVVQSNRKHGAVSTYIIEETETLL